MARKILLASTITLLVAGGLWWALSGDPEPSPLDRIVASDPGADRPKPPTFPDSPPDETDPVNTAEHRLDLGEGPAAISGTVRDPEGAGAADAEVTLFRSRLPADVEQEGGLSIFRVVEFRGWGTRALRELASADRIPFRPAIARGLDRIAEVVADAEGRYRFDGLASGRYIVAARAPGTLRTPTPTVHHVEEGTTHVDVALIAAVELAGVVIGEGGEPIANARVRIRGEIVPTDGGFEGMYLGREQLLLVLLNPVTRTARTDAAGEFVLTDLPPMSYQVHVTAESWAATERRLDVPEDSPTEIVLELGGSLEGIALDPAGAAVPGLEVSLFVEGGAGFGVADSFRPMPTAETDEDGRFSFPGLAPESYRLRTEGEGWIPADVAGLNVDRGEVRTVEVSLEPGARITGTVRDPDGTPVPEVEVAARMGRARSATTETDGSGRFTIDTIPGGEYELRFSRDGWLSADQEAETDGAPLEVTLVPGPEIRGRVIDTAGRPVARARLQSERDWTGAVRAESGADGTFAFRASRDDAFRLVVRAASFAETFVDVPEGGGDLGDVVIAEAARIEGVVFDPDGLPLPGARVVATRDDPNARQRWRRGLRQSTAWSNSDGAYSIEVDDPEATYQVRANYPLLLSSYPESIGLRGAGVEGVDLSLRWGASLFGVVLGPANVPVEGAALELRATGDGARGTRRSTRTKSGGEFQIAGLEAGTYQLRVSAAGCARTVLDDLAFAENEARRIEVRLRPEARLVGVVFDESGAPIERARISVSEPGNTRRSARSAPDGSFVVDRLGHGALAVTVDATGFLRYRGRDIYADDGPLQVPLRTAYEITGVVIDEGTGEPLRRARIRVDARVEGDGGNRRRSSWGRSDGDGLFSVGNLDIGDYRVRVQLEGYLTAEIPEVSIPALPSEEELLVALRPGGRVRGTVYDPVGRPLGGVRVRAYPRPEDETEVPTGPNARRGRPAAQDRTGGEGTFSVVGLEEGIHDLQFEHSDHLVEWREATVSFDRAETVLTVTLERGAEISGRVYAEAGGLQTEGNVVLIGPVRKRDRLGEDGKYRFAGLPPGDYTVQFRAGRAPADPAHQAAVSVGNQQARTVDLRL